MPFWNSPMNRGASEFTVTPRTRSSEAMKSWWEGRVDARENNSASGLQIGSFASLLVFRRQRT
jgi:hypothetical protein